MNEQLEVKLVKLIVSHCLKIDGSVGEEYVIVDIFDLAQEIDLFYKKLLKK